MKLIGNCPREERTRVTKRVDELAVLIYDRCDTIGRLQNIIDMHQREADRLKKELEQIFSEYKFY